jgi:hypothetical protein
MKKLLKRLLIISISVVLILFVGFKVLRMQTKQHSPEQLTEYIVDGLEMSIFYNRPYKKGREVFGKLVPYREVWRTGANEPTSFITNQDLKVGDKLLPKGEYTIWTIPYKDNWKVIFNGKKYNWGVRVKDGKASRESDFDIVTVEVPVKYLDEPIEQFTISFEDSARLKLIFEWDTVRVEVPLRD